MIILLIDADDQHHTEDDPKICLASDRRVFCGGRSRYSRAELQSDDKKAIWTQQKCNLTMQPIWTQQSWREKSIVESFKHIALKIKIFHILWQGEGRVKQDYQRTGNCQ